MFINIILIYSVLGSLYLASDKINPRISPEIEQMYFQLRTPCHYESFPVNEAERILESPYFDVNKKIVLFVSGWTSTIESSSIAHLAKAYNCRGDYNFLVSLQFIYTNPLQVTVLLLNCRP